MAANNHNHRSWQADRDAIVDEFLLFTGIFSFFFPSNSVVSAVDFVNGRGHVTARVRSSLLKKLEI